MTAAATMRATKSMNRLLLVSGIVTITLLQLGTYLPTNKETALLLYKDAPTNDPHLYDNQQLRPLEFVHITKTGGSAIEKAAAMANVSWGICHYQPGEECCQSNNTPKRNKRARRFVPKLKEDYQAFVKFEPWHTPHFWFTWPNLYQEADTFVVVRNPYDRIISEYYCQYFGYNKRYYYGTHGRGGGGKRLTRNRMGESANGLTLKHGQSRQESMNRRQGEGPSSWRRNDASPTTRLQERQPANPHHPTKPSRQQRRRQLSQLKLNPRRNGRQQQSVKLPETPKSLNSWIRKQLTRGFNPNTAHLTPQCLYVFDTRGQQVVTHVLKYESLAKDFSKLMQHYNLSIRLPLERNHYVNAGVAAGPKMTAQDLHPETLELIHKHYQDDFEMLGYTMKSV